MPTSTAKDARFVSTKRFTYGGREVEPGEYLNPSGQRNDRILFAGDSRYVLPAPDARDREDWPCDRCGRHFAAETQLRAHQARTYTLEHTAPEHVANLKQATAQRVGRKLKSESMAELAEDQGYAVVDVRRGPQADVPVIAPYA